MDRNKLLKELRAKGYMASDESGIVTVYITKEQYASGLAYKISKEIKAMGYDSSFGISDISRAKSPAAFNASRAGELDGMDDMTDGLDAPAAGGSDDAMPGDSDSGFISSLEELQAL